MKEKMKLRGMLLASLASSLWAISGISGEILFKKYNFSSDWLVSIRTLISGILLFVIVIFIEKKSVLKPLKNKKDFIGIILFGTAGMYLVQYTYFKTIELSNVSFSTILQFTAPFFIFIYESIKNKKIPAFSTLILLFMTILGVVFIATKGKISSLSVSPEALLLGLISAIMIAFYSIYPKKLLKKYGSITVVGWGMIVGSVVSNIVHPIWKIQGNVNTESIIQVTVVVILGTSVAYLIYIASLNYISSSLAGILTAFEPVLAAILSVIIFRLKFSFVELIGFVLVFVSIFILEKRL
ncbi:DMT family transporter [Leptotrichia wadei]|uniref:Putative membrane protein n=1 Tax=Leptotrichia wadei (strain F0279) TaxID=888055 RepID=U2RCL7_LEPWF|nr:EamA family transporter [Leptotrichia wadei]ERK48457.1 putative membrane protein [Leptotrichia wadei F0279]